MNILVTGGAGYIGSHACKALAAILRKTGEPPPLGFPVLLLANFGGRATKIMRCCGNDTVRVAGA